MSSNSLFIILSNIPFWVWPLLILLIVIGIKASKPRSMPIKFFWFLPLIGLMVIPTLVRIGTVSVLPIFLLAYAVGAWAGRSFQSGVITGVENGRIQLRGEWLTMTAVMAMFFANFAFGFARAVAPDTAQSFLFLLPFVFIIGLCSGSFFGRSLLVISRQNRTFL